MRLVLALIALGIVTAVPAEVNAQSWEEYRPDGGGFRVEMPGTPKLETKQSKNGNPDYYATVAFKKMAFLAVYSAIDNNNTAELGNSAGCRGPRNERGQEAAELEKGDDRRLSGQTRFV